MTCMLPLFTFYSETQLCWPALDPFKAAQLTETTWH